jgi:hypothetical protein
MIEFFEEQLRRSEAKLQSGTWLRHSPERANEFLSVKAEIAALRNALIKLKDARLPH